MSKKTVFLIMVMLLLGLATNASASVAITWSQDGNDRLWNTPENWDLQRVPSIATDDFAILQFEGALSCIIDVNHTDVNAAETNYLRVGHWNHGTGQLQMDGGVLTVGKTLIVGEDTIGRFYMNDGTVTSGEDILIGWGAAGNGSFTMSDGSLTTNYGKLVVGNVGGTGALTVQGGNINIGWRFFVGNDGGTGSLDVSGGTINIGKYLGIGRKLGTGVANISGGLINITGDLCLGHSIGQLTGIGTLIMTGGKISVGQDLKIGLEGSTGHLQLDGGTIYASDLIMDSNGTIDINAGTLVINGNCLEKINGYIQEPNNWITAVGGDGRLVIDYDIRNSGKTTMTALSNDSNLPRLTINVEPNEPNGIGVDSIVPPISEPIYCWQNQLIRIGAGPSRMCPYVYRFDRWEGDVADSSSSSTTLLMDTDKTITVVFYKDNKRKCGDECHPILQGDLSRDCHVNLHDFLLFASKWFSCTDPNCDRL